MQAITKEKVYRCGFMIVTIIPVLIAILESCGGNGGGNNPTTQQQRVSSNNSSAIVNLGAAESALWDAVKYVRRNVLSGDWGPIMTPPPPYKPEPGPTPDPIPVFGFPPAA